MPAQVLRNTKLQSQTLQRQKTSTFREPLRNGNDGITDRKEILTRDEDYWRGAGMDHSLDQRAAATSASDLCDDNLGIEWQDWPHSAECYSARMPKYGRLSKCVGKARDACLGPKAKAAFEPGRPFLRGLFARCAGVHVDFHAHRHFNNLRSFPGHSNLPFWRPSRATQS